MNLIIFHKLFEVLEILLQIHLCQDVLFLLVYDMLFLFHFEMLKEEFLKYHIILYHLYYDYRHRRIIIKKLIEKIHLNFYIQFIYLFIILIFKKK